MLKEKDFYYKKARLTQLRGFCSVVQSKYSITEASKKINVEPATLSRQVSALERDLGIKLFDRSEHKKLKPTKESDLFYKEAIEYINGIDGLFKSFNEKLKQFNDNHLNIGLHQMALTYIFPTILEKMLKTEEFKDLKITIHRIPRREAFKKLINKEIDLAFNIQNLRDSAPIDIEAIKSIQSRAFLIFSKLHPLAKKDTITMEDIEKYKFLKIDSEIKTLNDLNMKTSNITAIGTLSNESIIEIVKHTNYITIIPNAFLGGNSCLNDPDIVIKDVEHLLNDKAFFYIMTLKNHILSKPTLWIINELKKLV